MIALTLVVFRATRSCDSCGESLHLITDGRRAFASTEPLAVLQFNGQTTDAISREYAEITVLCPRVRSHRMVVCDGQARFDLSESQVAGQGWTPATTADVAALAGGVVL